MVIAPEEEWAARSASAPPNLATPSFGQPQESWKTDYGNYDRTLPIYQGEIPYPAVPYHPPLLGDSGIGDGPEEFPLWMTKPNGPSYADSRDVPGPPFLIVMAPGGQSCPPLADQARKHPHDAEQAAAAVAAMARDGDMGLGMLCGGVNPPHMPPATNIGQQTFQASADYWHGGDERQRPRNRTDSFKSAQPARNEAPAEPIKESDKVTIMIRNLPTNYGRDDVVELLNQHGFLTKYDFVYLPIDFKNSSGLGYAFVNMVSHEDATKAMEKLQGFKDWKVSSQKVCEVAWGDEKQQGLDEHIRRYRNSPVMHDSVKEEFKPLIFKDGVKIPFPAPTKAPPKPRMKKHARTGCVSPRNSDKEDEEPEGS